jgi:small subunit ribosomal protein S20
MPNSLSAKKRVRQNEKRRQLNRSKKSRIKTEVKKFLSSVEAGEHEAAEKILSYTTKLLDKAAKSNLLHPNRVARQKSSLQNALNASSGKE